MSWDIHRILASLLFAHWIYVPERTSADCEMEIGETTRTDIECKLKINEVYILYIYIYCVWLDYSQRKLGSNLPSYGWLLLNEHSVRDWGPLNVFRTDTPMHRYTARAPIHRYTDCRARTDTPIHRLPRSHRYTDRPIAALAPIHRYTGCRTRTDTPVAALVLIHQYTDCRARIHASIHRLPCSHWHTETSPFCALRHHGTRCNYLDNFGYILQIYTYRPFWMGSHRG